MGMLNQVQHDGIAMGMVKQGATDEGAKRRTTGCESLSPLAVELSSA